MDTTFDILQAIGLGLAFGLRPALAPLVVAVCAAANLAVDFDGTTFEFLEEPVALVALGVFAIAAVADVARITRSADAKPYAGGWLVVSVALAAVFGAGSVNEHSDAWYIGAVVGALAALLAWSALTPLLAGARARLAGEAEASVILPVAAELVAVLTAFLSLLFPPLAVIALVAVLVLLVRGRGKGEGRYAGLRTLTK